MSTQNVYRLTESEPPLLIDPKTIKKGYLVLPIGFANSIGHSSVPGFIGDTLHSACPELWKEVRRCQPNLEYEGFCIPDHVTPDPGIAISQLESLVDTSRYSIVAMSFDIGHAGQKPIRVFGGFCFPESPSRLVIPIKGKLLPKTNDSVAKDQPQTSKQWWQFWK